MTFEQVGTHFRYAYDLPIPRGAHAGFIEPKPKDNEIERFEVLCVSLYYMGIGLTLHHILAPLR